LRAYEGVCVDMIYKVDWPLTTARPTSCVARRAAHVTLRTTDLLNINLATILGPHKGFANGGNEYWYGMEYLKRAE
jgi:hypothetical protein